jgi:hypothetical protein
MIPNLALNGSESEFNVIKNPKPNLIEKNYVQLKKVGEIRDEVGKDEFLFLPASITMDRENNLYVYDLMQAKILKFDESLKFIKSFGRTGEGPGEFSGTGRGNFVFINIGLDGKLYAHDIRVLKVLVFNPDGRFIRQYRCKHIARFDKPIVDVEGNIILQDFIEDRQVIFNERDTVLFSLPQKEKKKEYLFKSMIPIFFKSSAHLKGKVVARKLPFFYDLSELKMRMTFGSTLILYFPRSSTLYLVKDKKQIKKMRIWPKEAIEYVKEETDTSMHKDLYRTLFSSIYLDGDQNNIFYLDFGKNKNKGIYCLYKMNLKGELMNVFYVPCTDNTLYNSFLLKQNHLFFAKQGEKITIYKEDKKCQNVNK